MKNYHLGINLGHDRSAAIVSDGEIKVAIQQERLDRSKHSLGYLHQFVGNDKTIQLPWEAINYCLEELDRKNCINYRIFIQSLTNISQYTFLGMRLCFFCCLHFRTLLQLLMTLVSSLTYCPSICTHLLTKYLHLIITLVTALIYGLVSALI